MKNMLRKSPLLAAMAGAMLVGANAQAQQQYSLDGNVSNAAPGKISGQAEQQAVLDYWTPERLKSARPMEIRLEGKPNPQSALSPLPPMTEPVAGDSSLQGDDGTVLRGEDVRAVLGLTGALEPDPIAPQATGDGVYSYPPPSTTYAIPVTWYGSFPIRAVGKVYFSLSGGNWVCSGAVIQTTSNDVIQTAGHCVSDAAGTFATNVIFKPAHRPAWDAPYGTWTARTLGARSSWHNGNNWCEDLGCIVANPNGNNQMIGEVVGELGYLYNASRTQHWHLFGYPAAGSWSGDTMVVSTASWNLNDDPGCTSGPNTIGVGWGQTGGSSGGPWVVTYKPQQSGANNYINGVNSYGYTTPDQPDQIYSPYFGNEFESLRSFCDDL